MRKSNDRARRRSLNQDSVAGDSYFSREAFHESSYQRLPTKDGDKSKSRDLRAVEPASGSAKPVYQKLKGVAGKGQARV